MYERLCDDMDISLQRMYILIHTDNQKGLEAEENICFLIMCFHKFPE